MPTVDARVDAYIERQRDFAQPILRHLRALVHRTCPDVAETLKWSSPAFVYRGEILAAMAAFKEHATFGFWKGELVTGGRGEGAMGSFGRIVALSDLPDDATLEAFVTKAMALADAGVKQPRVLKHPKPPLEAPPDFVEALAGNAAAKTTFDALPPSGQRDYVEWLSEAKRAETRERRLAQTVEWLAEGKPRNWKYQNC
ncbi:uncharacterized protein YdeI (YjbR/CyaY-like superfamily) [Sphingomonas zeicaulis]|uniref:YdeI/OmpD-associated family protein n=1 Tax=Sphingomonas zeicaulis TaxID=1632740 RepID=UPI003D233763